MDVRWVGILIGFVEHPRENQKEKPMVEIIIAISLWCGAVGTTPPKEVRECQKTMYKCIKQKTTCSSCWSISIPVQIYDAVLSACIEDSL